MNRAGRAALCVTLGSATTLAVAWGLALQVVVPVSGPMYARTSGPYRDPDTDRQYYCQVKTRPGLTAVVWEPQISPTLLQQYVAQRLSSAAYGNVAPQAQSSLLAAQSGTTLVLRDPSSGNEPVGPEAIPWWARHLTLGSIPGTHSVASARGWPMRALWSEGTLVGQARQIEGGVFTPPALRFLGPGPVLPLWPIPEGIVVDIAFYGAIWYVLLATPAALRRARRRNRGHCAQCGYDLRHRGGRCPECGAGHEVFC